MRRKNPEYSAVCTWGLGPDVLVRIDTDELGYSDLTTAQALDLAAQLIKAATDAVSLDLGYAMYVLRNEAGVPQPPIVYEASIEDAGE